MSKAFARLAGGVLATAATVFVASAQAGVVYRGAFDPASYQGIATFDVAPDCVPGSGFTGFTFPDDTCGSVDFVSGTVTNDPSAPSTGTLQFGFQSDVATALRWEAGVLIGLDTFLIGPQASITGDFFDNPPYFLQFSAGSSDGGIGLSDIVLQQSGTPPTVQLFECTNSELEFSCTPFDGTADQFPYQVVSIPEPGSLALIGFAMVAGWAARRRRS